MAEAPERIYLQPKCCETPDVGRLWCEHDAPVACEDGVPWTEYVRADCVEALANGRRCDICGERLVTIRGRYPGDDDREVCPTCLQERTERAMKTLDPESYIARAALASLTSDSPTGGTDDGE